MIFDVAGAAAEVAVQRLGNRLLEIGAGDRRLRQALEKDLALVEEARRAIAALEGKIINESLLQRRELTVLRMAFHGANRFAVEACGRDDAGRARIARPVGIIDDDRTTQALRGAAAQPGPGPAALFA